MDYKILSDEISRKGYSYESLATEIGMSKGGLYQAFKKDTLRLRDFVAICGILNIDPDQMAARMSGKSGSTSTRKRYLEDVLQDIEEKVDSLKNQLSELSIKLDK